VKHLKWTLLLTAVLATATTADARPRRFNSTAMTPQSSYMPMTMPQVSYSPTTAVYDQPSMVTQASYPTAAVPTAAAPVVSSGGLAQQKADIQARAGNCFHPGGSLGGGTHEGCGYSSVSADHAIRSCCYWGQRTPIDIGVARGANGWYACVIYR
jgi:hypothetical protein